MVQAIGTTVGWIYNSQGRTDLQLKWGIFAIGLILPVTWQSWQYLIVQLPFGVVIYGVLIHLFGVQAYREAVENRLYFNL